VVQFAETWEDVVAWNTRTLSGVTLSDAGVTENARGPPI
jgi:hypothetical protein